MSFVQKTGVSIVNRESAEPIDYTVQAQVIQQPRLQLMNAFFPQRQCLISTQRLAAIYHHDTSEGKQGFEHLLFALVGSAHKRVKIEIRNDVFSAIHYREHYHNLSPRQKKNIGMFGHLSPDEVQVLSQEVLDELCRGTNTDISNIRINLSAEYFRESPIDFAFHLLEFKQAAHVAQITLNKAFQDYKYCRNSIIVDVKPETTLFILSARSLVLLPPEIGSLSRIKTLKIPSNRLQSLPPELLLLSRLEVLCATRNMLTSLPAELGDMTGLIELDLSLNQLTNLPKDLGRLSRLKFLDVRKNRLVNLPSEIGLLTQLEQLNIQKNALSSLPLEIVKLSQLRSLQIHFNLFTDVPEEFAKMPQFQYLQVSNVQFQALSPAFIQRKAEGSLTIIKRW